MKNWCALRSIKIIFLKIPLKIDAMPDTSPEKLLMNLSELLKPVVTLLRDPKMCSYEKVLSNGLRSIHVLTLIKSDELIQLFFNAITKYVLFKIDTT